MKPIPFSELVERLSAQGVILTGDECDARQQYPHVYHFSRTMMGCGSPSYPVVARSQDHIIEVPVIEALLHIFGVPVEEFWKDLVGEA